MKAYITKYWETQGITVLEGRISDTTPSIFIADKNKTSLEQYFHGNDWWGSRKDAAAWCEEKRKKKLKALQKKIKTIEKMKF